MRFIHLMVIGALILAAAVVYKIKFDSTLQAEQVGKLRSELRKEREAIAVLRAEWAKLQTPARLEELARRHLQLQPMTAPQNGDFSRLPERPPQLTPPQTDPDGAMIDQVVPGAEPAATGSIAPQR
jgi:cell division protein FtsL